MFGIGSFIYHLLEFITYFIIDLHPNCLDVLHTVNSFLSIIFVVLQVLITQYSIKILQLKVRYNGDHAFILISYDFQTVAIIMYPRLNINLGNGVAHLGLMHIVATNLVIWMRTVIKESFHSYNEARQMLGMQSFIKEQITFDCFLNFYI